MAIEGIPSSSPSLQTPSDRSEGDSSFSDGTALPSGKCYFSPESSGRFENLLDDRYVKAHSSKSMVNPEARARTEAVENYNDQCRIMENLFGQRFTANNVKKLQEYLQSPLGEPDELPFEVVYVKGDNLTFVIPPEESLKADSELASELNQALNIKTDELVSHFKEQEVIDSIETRTAEASETLTRCANDLGNYFSEKPNPIISPSPILLDVERLEEAPYIPGLTAPSIQRKSSIKNIESEPDSRFILLPDDKAQEFQEDFEAREDFEVLEDFKVDTHLIQHKETQQWVDFYSNPDVKMDGQQKSLRDIYNLTEEQLQSEQDYFHMLFPAVFKSTEDPNALPLNKTMVYLIDNEPLLQNRLKSSLDLMLKLWGCQREGDHISIDPNASEQRWLFDPDNPNQNRVTHLLATLKAFGYESCACSLEQALQHRRITLGLPLNPSWSKALLPLSRASLKGFSESES